MGSILSGRMGRRSDRPRVEELAPIDVRRLARLGAIEPGAEWHATPAPVLLEWTPCTLGGRRPWFVCPGCGRRAAILYRGPSLTYPECRRCLGLVYASQSQNAMNRARERAKAIRWGLLWPQLMPRLLEQPRPRVTERIVISMYLHMKRPPRPLVAGGLAPWEPFPPRPPRMHRRTYERLRAETLALERPALQALAAEKKAAQRMCEALMRRFGYS